jgi:hypothetical protein
LVFKNNFDILDRQFLKLTGDEDKKCALIKASIAFTDDTLKSEKKTLPSP